MKSQKHTFMQKTSFPLLFESDLLSDVEVFLIVNQRAYDSVVRTKRADHQHYQDTTWYYLSEHQFKYISKRIIASR